MAAPHAAHVPRRTPLGSIESTASVPALLSALQALRPQWFVYLEPISSTGAPRYRVEIEARATGDDGVIDIWLHIKSALIATFPADKPNAVTAVDP